MVSHPAFHYTHLKMSNLNPFTFSKSFLFLALIILALLISVVNSSMVGKVIQILQGDVRGRTSMTRGGRYFTEYWGIPYGKKPERFELARPAPSWDGVKECSKKPSPCFFQAENDHTEGSEDCLFINVHTPQTHNFYYLKKMPVIVVIHGGFQQWSDQTGHFLGAKYFLDKDVVLVSFNYRLGAFGFFTTQDETMHANLGLKDQVLALKWVQKNIEFFGGDSNSVTILGYGAGGASVHMHMLSPMSKGLFHKAITQSGNALCPWAIVDDPEKSFSTFVTNLKCDGNLESKAVVDCLKRKPALEIVKETYNTQYIFSKERDNVGNAVYFGPVVEHWMRNFPESPCFLPDYPQNILINGTNETVATVPLMTGINEYDGVTKQHAEIVNRQSSNTKVNVDWSITTKSFGKFFSYTNKVNDTDKIDKKIDEFYFKILGEEWIREDRGLKFFEALGHRNYFQGTRNQAVKHAKLSGNVFLYYFTYFRGTSFLDYWFRGFNVRYDMLKKQTATLQGPCNGDELQYLFDLDEMGDFPLIRKIYREMSMGFSINLILLWVNFAKTGIPSSDWEPLPQGQDIASVKWHNIGDIRTMIDEPFRPQLDFWDYLFPLIVIQLPPLKPKNETHHHRAGTGQDEILDIIYVDAQGDDDGTGGLFEWVAVPSNSLTKQASVHNSSGSSGPQSGDCPQGLVFKNNKCNWPNAKDSKSTTEAETEDAVSEPLTTPEIETKSSVEDETTDAAELETTTIKSSAEAESKEVTDATQPETPTGSETKSSAEAASKEATEESSA